ncbi:MAG: SUMF1/EgtB/PvdO family nonheme iron enzyme [Myxococcota bacterium]|nr:SUMF1/EgtB/PvdO family nonheme iron enzyme [Myxococcota bacterium]
MPKSPRCFIVLALFAILPACKAEEATCTSNDDCGQQEVCYEGYCYFDEYATGDDDDSEVCESNSYSVCSDGIAYWYDSCGQLQGVREECENTACEGGVCVEPTCEDATQNGEETDVDCGGSCGGCGAGLSCLRDSDCESLVCSANVCAEVSCSDSVTNGSETDIDCGGTACAGCELGGTCNVGADCGSGSCQNGVCVVSGCNDGMLNGSESDVDCGGTDCIGCEENGACNSNDDCISNECVSGSCSEFKCPTGMTRVGNRAVCIDNYEASAFSNADCTGTQYGLATTDDYPAGFPDLVTSEDCGAACDNVTNVEQTTAVYACSTAGVIPSANITWYQARRACQNSNKTLCSLNPDWQRTCDNDQGSAYPYGETYVQGRCNGGFAGDPPSGPTYVTGAMSQCHGQGFASSVYDMSGNVAEWTDSCYPNPNNANGPYVCRQAGGAHTHIMSELACNQPKSVDNTTSDDLGGFRCCWTP